MIPGDSLHFGIGRGWCYKEKLISSSLVGTTARGEVYLQENKALLCAPSAEFLDDTLPERHMYRPSSPPLWQDFFPSSPNDKGGCYFESSVQTEGHTHFILPTTAFSK